MGIIFNTLKYFWCGDLDSDSEDSNTDSESEKEEEINNLQFEELKQCLKYFMIYRQCH